MAGRVLQNSGLVSRELVEVISDNFEIPRKVPNIARNIGFFSCVAVVHQQTLSICLIIWLLRLYLVVSCLRSFSVATEPLHTGGDVQASSAPQRQQEQRASLQTNFLDSTSNLAVTDLRSLLSTSGLQTFS